MKQLKVMTIVGTRPELIKLSRVLAELDERTQHIFVHTGQNFDYELNEIFFQQMGIRKPDYSLSVGGGASAATIANVITHCDEVFERESPDAMLILGDTNSCLSVIPAKRRRIPIFHMEAGNRCFDLRVPEEINRKIIDHTSDINLPYTEHARRYLIAEGLRPEMIIKTGSPMTEVLHYYWQAIEQSEALEHMGLERGRFFVVSVHREENVDKPEHLESILAALTAVAMHYRMPVIVSTHPRTRQRLKSEGIKFDDKRIRFVKPMGFFDYVQLQRQAFCTLSDSGTLTEESAILNFPGVMIRQAHERPEGMDEAAVIMAGLDTERILQAVKTVTDHHRLSPAGFGPIADYEGLCVSKKVVRIILSYVDYVNRTVWHR